ncbi:MAG: hypothetical protein A2Y15_04245 [Clostridiales bacterium GWF2_36_10]|nr:MAG: hypothetical protein A2Y15_04245 [Clostridiales bacterium GWF2_36_10]HAN20512.1 4Fe-4S ferredoxin [Clostridiales bacterium]
MKRKIIKINEDKCNGCGLCATACHEGAIAIIDSKAKLIRDDYCDGLGNCLPICPTGAITFEEREALAYNEEEVKKNMEKSQPQIPKPPTACGCLGINAHSIKRVAPVAAAPVTNKKEVTESMLRQWPVQIKLVPVNAPYFEDANLLIAADCAAYAYADFHNQFIRNRIVLIGCPKLDSGDYSEKLTEILTRNNIKSVTIVRMEVPCCGGIESAVKTSLRNCGKLIQWSVNTITINGNIQIS